MENMQIYAGTDEARSTGTGIEVSSSFVSKHDNLYVAGFKKDVVYKGSHYISLHNFYASDEINSLESVNPNEEIFNRGYAIVLDPTVVSGEHQTSGLNINGGWIHNSSLDLSGGAHGTIQNIDIEPASQSVLVGTGFTFKNCRFERMDYYALIGLKYPRFNWFTVLGDENKFYSNAVHASGANNKAFTNSKFKILGNNNSLIFDKATVHYGLVEFSETGYGNYVELNRFNDFDKLETEWPNFFAESIEGVFEGNNKYKLRGRVGYIEVLGGDLEIKACSSVSMTNAPISQGATVTDQTYTIASDDTGNNRIILNFNSLDEYEQGADYALKYKVTSEEGVRLSFRTHYLFNNTVEFTGDSEKDNKIQVRRFHIPLGEAVKIEPTIEFSGDVGKTLTISEIELIRMDEGTYVPDFYDN